MKLLKFILKKLSLTKKDKPDYIPKHNNLSYYNLKIGSEGEAKESTK